MSSSNRLLACRFIEGTTKGVPNTERIIALAKNSSRTQRTGWKGTDEARVPAQKIEPYRLWFEFLRLALNDPTINVDREHYAAWGQIEQADFRQWWAEHWRGLFAVDIGVRVLDSTDDLPRDADSELVVRIPLYQDKSRTLKELAELLEEHGAGERLADMKQGQFYLSVGLSETGRPIHPSTRFLRNLPKVRLLLNLYGYWLEHEGLNERQRLEQTATSYFNWADAWNTKIRQRNWKRRPIEIPTAISEYVAYLKQKGGRKRVRLSELNESDVSNHRRQIARYIRKARRIAENVAQGTFPGVYENTQSHM